MANILAVDDEAGLLQMVEAILTQNGHTVCYASSGIEALMVFSSYQERVDVVLTDIFMPGMNGIELAERIHAINPHVGILLMSGFVPGDLRVPQDFLLLKKPFFLGELTDALNDVLAGRHPKGSDLSL